jgi:hypothetical protein
MWERILSCFNSIVVFYKEFLAKCGVTFIIQQSIEQPSLSDSKMNEQVKVEK